MRPTLQTFSLVLCVLAAMTACSTEPPPAADRAPSSEPIAEASDAPLEVGQLDLVASLNITPGNVTVSSDGRIFASVHGLRRGEAQLIEVFPGDNQWQPFPDRAWNAAPGSGEDVLNTPHGVIIDGQNRLWVIDHGNWMPEGQAAAQPKLIAFDIETGELVYRLELDSTAAPAGQLLQDLAIDEEQGVVYVADSGASPGILTIDLDSGQTWRWEGHPSLQAEDLDVVAEGSAVAFWNSEGEATPARIAVNPITLSADRTMLFYGAMSGSKIYGVDATLLRSQAPAETLAETVTIIGEKPVSDGISTDAEGNHFVSNLKDNAIDILDSDGERSRLLADERFLWIDSLRFGPDSWLYFNINQLHRAAAFSETGIDTGEAPYQIFRVWTGTQGLTGR